MTNRRFRLFWIPLVLVAACAALVGVQRTVAATAPAPGATLANLQEAFNGESNANARYTAFAVKADAEGHPDVAALFRAAAHAEKIHAENHAKVIRALGAEPKATIETPAPKTTADNLKAAVAGESYERDKMYPDFIAVARREANKDALRSFNFAKEAEAGHAVLYQAALDTLKPSPSAKAEFYVCPVCGRTERVRPGGKCPVCFTDASKWEKVG